MRNFRFLSTPHGTLGTETKRALADTRTFLSTPHGTLGTGLMANGRYKPLFEAFNSTRYIRNSFPACPPLGGRRLSTPHGTLGTLVSPKASEGTVGMDLSTPHGTLGTKALDWVEGVPVLYRLSTPHGTLGTKQSFEVKDLTDGKILSTPHGTLGTVGGKLPRCWLLRAFNSTRYIRNRLEDLIKEVEALLFQLHTVH